MPLARKKNELYPVDGQGYFQAKRFNNLLGAPGAFAVAAQFHPEDRHTILKRNEPQVIDKFAKVIGLDPRITLVLPGESLA